MAASGNGVGEDELQQMAELSKTLKEGERILGPTRRPDGTLRKSIRIRAGYVPQDEVPIYQSKGALWRKEMELASQDVPPGYDPVLDVKPKSKSAKRNERKKEKRLKAALNKAENEKEESSSVENASQSSDYVDAVASELNKLAVSVNSNRVSTPANSEESPNPDIDKRIRALKKKIRLTEAQLQKTEQQDMKPEQLDKVSKLEEWRKELKLLEDKKEAIAAS